jgi:hypothetical protein
MTTNQRLVGHVCVDVGCVAITDPTHTDKVYDLLDHMIDHNLQTASSNGVVVSQTGLGDGFYPVYVETADIGFGGESERVVRIIIDCGVTDPQRAFLDQLSSDET